MTGSASAGSRVLLMHPILNPAPALLEEAACEVLLADYDVDAEQLHRDVEGLVKQLVGHGLLELHTS